MKEAYRVRTKQEYTHTYLYIEIYRDVYTVYCTDIVDTCWTKRQNRNLGYMQYTNTQMEGELYLVHILLKQTMFILNF